MKSGIYMWTSSSGKSYIGQASQLLSTYACHITACCKGQRKSAGGYIWKYKKEND